MMASKINKYNSYWYVIILFLFITDLNWIIFPISTRKLIGLIGFGFLSLKGFHSYNTILKNGIGLYMGCIIILCLSSIINACVDTSVLSMFIGRILTVLGAYYIFTTWKTINLIKFLKIFINIVLINDIIALVLFLSPNLNMLFLTIEPVPDSVMEVYGGLRLMGLGAFRFFEGGIINSLALVSVFYLLLENQLTRIRTTILIISFLFLGIFIARTALLGILGFLFILYPSWAVRFNLIKVCVFIGSIAVLVFLLFNTLYSGNPALEWAFEIIYNYLDNGSIKTTSTDGLIAMYIFPDSIKGWIIGDAKWLSPDGKYYMKTDVGFCRLLLLFGLTGCIYYFGSIFRIIIKVTKFQELKIKMLLYIIFLLLIVVNLKGFSDFSYFLFPILFYTYRNYNEYYTQSKADTNNI